MSLVSKSKIQEYASKEPQIADQGSQYFLSLYDTYYVNQQKKWFMEWNWYAFFLGPIWLAYRGMFWVSVALILILHGLEAFSLQMYLIGVISVWMLIGFYGNALYLMHLLYWVESDTLVKRGVDTKMACLVSLLFLARIITKLISHLSL